MVISLDDISVKELMTKRVDRAAGTHINCLGPKLRFFNFISFSAKNVFVFILTLQKDLQFLIGFDIIKNVFILLAVEFKCTPVGYVCLATSCQVMFYYFSSAHSTPSPHSQSHVSCNFTSTQHFCIDTI